jgi:glycosyltransferase involved in cell wall biosynthesis
MWNNNGVPSEVIDHGIVAPPIQYQGDLKKGIVVINNLSDRGRRLGVDIFLEARKHVPLDLIGMNTKEIGGLGEILHPQLPEFISRYRFFFNPIRYTSLGLAVLEAMMVGVPVVGMATTELVTVIKNNVSGFIHTDLSYLIARMQMLIANKEVAARIGQEGRKTAIERFNIKRFINDWENLFRRVIEQCSQPANQVWQQTLEK